VENINSTGRNILLGRKYNHAWGKYVNSRKASNQMCSKNVGKKVLKNQGMEVKIFYLHPSNNINFSVIREFKALL